MTGNNVFDYMWVERQKASLQGYRDQNNHYYQTENEHLKQRYRFDIEQYRANMAQSLEHQRGTTALELERQRHYGRLEIEDKRGVLAQWLERFRRDTSLEIENSRVVANKELEAQKHSGALTIQEREHIHQRTLFEIQNHERGIELDAQHAKHLELTGQVEEFAKFREQRERAYELDLRRFDALINERKTISGQMLQEYASRNELGAAFSGFTSSILQNNAQSNARMNEKILDAAIGVLLAKQQSKQEKAATGAATDAVDGQIKKWEDGA